MRVIAYGEELLCTRAVKGDDFIHLYDEHGAIFASFEGVNRFDDYQIVGGEWETLTQCVTIDERVTTLEADSAETKEALEMILSGVTE